MECETKKVLKVYLALEEVEAKWLKNYLQNSMVPLEEENETDAEMRRTFFNVLDNALKK